MLKNGDEVKFSTAKLINRGLVTVPPTFWFRAVNSAICILPAIKLSSLCSLFFFPGSYWVKMEYIAGLILNVKETWFSFSRKS